MSEPQRNIRVGPLVTVGGVVREMGKLYREARKGTLQVEKASRLIYMLSQLRVALETAALEARVAHTADSTGPVETEEVERDPVEVARKIAYVFHLADKALAAKALAERSSAAVPFEEHDREAEIEKDTTAP